MPQSDGGYISLGGGPNNNTVYNSTTEPQKGPKSIYETVKRVIGQTIGAQDTHKLIHSDGNQPFIITTR